MASRSSSYVGPYSPCSRWTSRAEPGTSDGGIRFPIIINADGPEEVDELADRLRQAGEP